MTKLRSNDRLFLNVKKIIIAMKNMSLNTASIGHGAQQKGPTAQYFGCW